LVTTVQMSKEIGLFERHQQEGGRSDDGDAISQVQHGVQEQDQQELRQLSLRQELRQWSLQQDRRQWSLQQELR
jgi:hypothetical protein